VTDPLADRLSWLRACAEAARFTPEAFELDGLLGNLVGALVALDAVLALAAMHEHGALRWEARWASRGGFPKCARPRRPRTGRRDVPAVSVELAHERLAEVTGDGIRAADMFFLVARPSDRHGPGRCGT
jgi:hypothetical protein